MSNRITRARAIELLEGTDIVGCADRAYPSMDDEELQRCYRERFGTDVKVGDRVTPFPRWARKMMAYGMPPSSVKKLREEYDVDTPVAVLVFPDPMVDGTFAARIQLIRSVRGKPVRVTLDLLWCKGEWEEVEYAQWPPKTGSLKFF